MFTFNDKYLLKSMMSLVRDESDRIISLGLASREGIKNFIEPVLYDIIKQANGNRSVVLAVLTDIHNNLDSVRLPGDFEKISVPIDQQLYEEMELPLDIKVTDSNTNVSPVEESVEENTDDEEKEEIRAVCSFLENIAYKLGMKGSHEAAYLVERTKYNIIADSSK